MKIALIIAALIGASSAVPLEAAVDTSRVVLATDEPYAVSEVGAIAGTYMVCRGRYNAEVCTDQYGAECWNSGEFYCPRSPNRFLCTSSVCFCYSQ